ncbi:MAG: hypothetical protein R6X22_01735 [Gemmatimonadota bacterium]
MPDYVVFGGRLRSDVRFPHPEVPEEPGVDWVLRVARRRSGPERCRALLGTDSVEPGVEVAMFRSDDGYELRYDDTGSFHVSPDGDSIAWVPGGEPSVGLAWIDLTSRVLATSLHARGRLVLHGSAVSIEGRAVAFVAPKGAGKSTLALALARAGGRLLTDDTLPVEPGDPARAGPGLHSVRLWPDSAGWLAVPPGDLVRATDGKGTLVDLEPEMLERARIPLAAVYVVIPVPPNTDVAAVERRRLPEVEAALSLVAFSKLGPLLGGSERLVVLRRAVEICRSVPVFTLRVARDHERLHEAVACLRQWHSRS